MSLEECINSLDDVSQKLRGAFLSVKEKEEALLERERAVEQKLLAIQQQEEEISSYKKVSWYNKLCIQVDDLKCKNELLTRSNDALKKYLKERGCTREEAEQVAQVEALKKEPSKVVIVKSSARKDGGQEVDTSQEQENDKAPLSQDAKRQEESGNVGEAEEEEDEEAEEEEEEDEEELTEITFKGKTYNTDSNYLYDTDSGEAVGYKYKKTFRLYRKNKTQK